jgi:motility quorum-sensing regulator/GCU-specific mRNA interferase toxin
MVYSGMTEKKTAHHDLEAIKVAFSKGNALFTRVATQDAAALGYGSEEIVSIIQTMKAGQLFKSMTSHYDENVWQDVYHVPHVGGTLYVKFTDNASLTEFTLLSFKEK